MKLSFLFYVLLRLLYPLAKLPCPCPELLITLFKDQMEFPHAFPQAFCHEDVQITTHYYITRHLKYDFFPFPCHRIWRAEYHAPVDNHKGVEHCVPVINPRGRNSSTHCIMVSEWSGKTHHSQAQDGVTLHLHREEAQQYGFQQSVPVLYDQWVSPGCCRQSSLPNTPSHAVVKGTSCGVGQMPYHAHTLSRNKRTLIESRKGKYIPTQGNKLGTGCLGSLFLGKDVF